MANSSNLNDFPMRSPMSEICGYQQRRLGYECLHYYYDQYLILKIIIRVEEIYKDNIEHETVCGLKD